MKRSQPHCTHSEIASFTFLSWKTKLSYIPCSYNFAKKKKKEQCLLTKTLLIVFTGRTSFKMLLVHAVFPLSEKKQLISSKPADKDSDYRSLLQG